MIFPTMRASQQKIPSPSDDFWYVPMGLPTVAGVRVDEAAALKYLTVYACVSLVAQDIGRIPLILYKKLRGGGKERAVNHPLYDILHSLPNKDTTSFLYRETGQGHLMLWGNSFSIIERSGAGDVAGLWQLPDPSKVEKFRSKNGDIFYEHSPDGEKKRILSDDQVFHVPGFGFNGLYGLSMITLAREAIGLGLAAEQFGSRFFGSGTHPSGVMEMEGDLGENRVPYLEAVKKQYQGLGKSHNMMVLERGAKYKPLTMPLEDAQFLETRNHQKTEICGMYHVPPHKIALHGQNSNYSNLEQENGSYVQSCIMPWAVRWETSISTQLLTQEERRQGYFAEYEVEGLLRGDSSGRADFYSKMMGLAAISPDEIREKENMNPLPDKQGEQYFVMANLMPIDQAGDNGVTAAPGDEQIPGQGIKAKELKSREIKLLPGLEYHSRSIAVRDRIASRYRTLIFDAARQIVSRETKTLIAKAKKYQNEPRLFMDWVVGYYRDEFRTFAGQRIRPILTAYIDSIMDVSYTEIASDYDPDEHSRFSADYVSTYLTRHAGSSQGQILDVSAMPNDPGLNVDAVVMRMDEWDEKRPEKIAENENVRAAMAAFGVAVFSVGRSVVWRIRGAETCPYCRRMDGRRVSRGGSFANSGDYISDPKNPQKKMKIRGITRHPPLHQGCDCTLSAF